MRRWLGRARASRCSSSPSSLLALARPVARGLCASTTQEQLAHGEETISYGSLPALVALRRRRARELAVGVPPVLALHRSRRSGSSSEARTSRSGWRTRASRPTSTQRVGPHAPERRPALGEGARLAPTASTRTRSSLVMGAIFLGDLVRHSRSATGRTYNEEQAAHGEPSRLVAARYVRLADFWDRRRSRTGSRSFSPSGRWPSSRSTSASAARRSPSRSGLAARDDRLDELEARAPT